MPRKKDRFCEYVTFLDDKGSKWKCTFCGEEFSGGGTRIKAHLAKAERYGIKKCVGVVDQVRTQAWEALCGKRVQDPDGADKRSISPHHRSMNTAVPDDAHRPMNHQPKSSEDCIGLLYHCPNESSGAEVVEVQPQAQMYDGSSTHQGLGQQPPNVQQTNTELQVPQGGASGNYGGSSGNYGVSWTSSNYGSSGNYESVQYGSSGKLWRLMDILKLWLFRKVQYGSSVNYGGSWTSSNYGVSWRCNNLKLWLLRNRDISGSIWQAPPQGNYGVSSGRMEKLWLLRKL